MKKGIHPEYFPEATVTCSCGATWVTGSTRPQIRTDVCSMCHPFYTGEQRIIDTAGQVERFMKRLQIKQDMDQSRQAIESAREAEEQAVRRARARGDDVEAAREAVRQEIQAE